jgi:hypothetical protein
MSFRPAVRGWWWRKRHCHTRTPPLLHARSMVRTVRRYEHARSANKINSLIFPAFEAKSKARKKRFWL